MKKRRNPLLRFLHMIQILSFINSKYWWKRVVDYFLATDPSSLTRMPQNLPHHSSIINFFNPEGKFTQEGGRTVPGLYGFCYLSTVVVCRVIGISQWMINYSSSKWLHIISSKMGIWHWRKTILPPTFLYKIIIHTHELYPQKINILFFSKHL